MPLDEALAVAAGAGDVQNADLFTVDGQSAPGVGGGGGAQEKGEASGPCGVAAPGICWL